MKTLKIGFVVTLSGRWPEELPQKRLSNYGKWAGANLQAEVEIYGQPARTPGQVQEAVVQFRRAGVDLVLLLYGAFTGDDAPCALAEELGVPIILWAPGEPGFERDQRLYANDYCAATMNAASLRRLGLPYHVLLGDVQDARITSQLQRLVRVYSLMKNMRGSMLGLFGYRPTAYYNSTFNETLIRQTFGVCMEATELKTVFDRMAAQDFSAVEADMKAIGARFDPSGLPPGHHENHSRLYLALKELWAGAGYDFAAIKCWPEMGAAHTQPCAVLGRLADEDICIACETDVDAALTMQAQHLLTGKAPFIADIVHMKEEENKLVFWHCGNPAPSLLDKGDGISFLNHPLVGQGSAFYGVLKPGAVTLARLANVDGRYRLFLQRGEATPTRRNTKGAMVDVKMKTPVRDIWNCLLEEGFAHHYCLVWEDVAAELRQWAKVMGIEVFEP